MKAQTIGRTLGVGVRIAGRMIGQSLSGQGSTSSAQATGAVLNQSRQAVDASRKVKRGIGGFLRPFGRAGAIVGLQVSGVFYLMFCLGFCEYLWRIRSSMIQGPEHAKFLVATGVAALFLYLSLSSFWRAGKK